MCNISLKKYSTNESLAGKLNIFYAFHQIVKFVVMISAFRAQYYWLWRGQSVIKKSISPQHFWHVCVWVILLRVTNMTCEPLVFFADYSCNNIKYSVIDHFEISILSKMVWKFATPPSLFKIEMIILLLIHVISVCVSCKWEGMSLKNNDILQTIGENCYTSPTRKKRSQCLIIFTGVICLYFYIINCQTTGFETW